MSTLEVLKGKSVYCFGDSIIYGHTAPEKSFMKMITEENSMKLTMCAINGATVIVNNSNNILCQIEKAPAEKPDFILFDGYTNDAYERYADSWGEITENGANEFDISSFCGGFEQIIASMKEKWGETHIFFVTIHKNGARDWEVQCKLRGYALKICCKWGVEVIDIFKDSELDTREKSQMEENIIGGSGSHPNEQGCRKYYMPFVTKKIELFLSE